MKSDDDEVSMIDKMERIANSVFPGFAGGNMMAQVSGFVVYEMMCLLFLHSHLQSLDAYCLLAT